MSTVTLTTVQLGDRLLIENAELRLQLDNAATEWAVILDDGSVYGIYGTEAGAWIGLRDFDREDPETPAFIVSRKVGPWVKRTEEEAQPRGRAYTVNELDVATFRKILRQR
jgi:NADPH-dependent ferric siderophore reductase